MVTKTSVTVQKSYTKPAALTVFPKNRTIRRFPPENAMNYWKNRSLLKLADHSREAILDLLDRAAALKAAKKAGTETARLHGTNIALIFEKTSTRTPLKSPALTRAHIAATSAPAAASLATKKASPTPRASSAASTTPSNTAASRKAPSKRWRRTPAFPCTTA